MASLNRQKLVNSLHDVGLNTFPSDCGTDHLRQIYLSYCQAKDRGCSSLSDEQMFQLLKAFGTNPGPIMPTTRLIYQNKLTQKIGNLSEKDSLGVGKERDSDKHKNNDDEDDLIFVEQRALQVGASLSSTPRIRTVPVTVHHTPSPIRSDPVSQATKDPQTSTPKQDSSAALGLFTSPKPTNPRVSPPRQSRILGDFSITDIPNKAPASVINRRSVWPSNNLQYKPYTHENVPLSRYKNDNSLGSNRPIIPSPQQIINKTTLSTDLERTNSRITVQIVTVVLIGLFVFLAYIFLEENPSRPLK
ncbi:hypothetical protein GJ496_010280 [Pomphorhynchus laevis]|nr:hypothetical protein GJ496_010280 [Pomphorhynchus laevis]